MISTRSIYDDGTNPARTYEVTSSSNTFIKNTHYEKIHEEKK
jgi:hypothetical protein